MQNYSGYYKRELKTEDSYFTTDLNYYTMNFNTDESFNDNYYNIQNQSEKEIERKQNTVDKKLSINYKFDYVQKINDIFSLETGYNLYFRAFEDNFTNTETSYFKYKETRNSGYFILNYNAKNFSVSSGVRAETGENTVSDTISYNTTYLLPNFNVLYKINKQNILRLSLKKFITHPEYRSLKPFVYQEDSLNYQLGNPLLKPSETTKLAVSYNFNRNDFQFSISVYHKIYINSFGKNIFINENKKYTQTNNIGNGTSTGVELTSSFKMLKTCVQPVTP